MKKITEDTIELLAIERFETEGYTYRSCIFLTQSDMTEYLHSVAEGSTSAYSSLKSSDLVGVEFQLPPKEKLENFQNLLTRPSELTNLQDLSIL